MKRCGKFHFPHCFVFHTNYFECRKYALSEIPVILELNSGNYELAGLIEYRQGHFIPYCRFRDDLWEDRDDMKLNNKKKRLSWAGINVPMSLNCMLYVKIE